MQDVEPAAVNVAAESQQAAGPPVPAGLAGADAAVDTTDDASGVAAAAVTCSVQATATGNSLYSGMVTLNTSRISSTSYVLQDPTRYKDAAAGHTGSCQGLFESWSAGAVLSQPDRLADFDLL